jgi:hypothetical protein
MSNHADKAISIADRVLSLVEDGLRPLERTIAAWPAEFSAIVWETVADIAARRASELRQKAR